MKKETIVNGLSVAAKVTALQPNFPIVDNQAQVNFVQNKASGSATQLFPIGALTKEVKEEIWLNYSTWWSDCLWRL
jgi:dihydroorotase